MASEIPITNVTLPNASIRILNTDGTLTLPWRKFFQDMFLRTGGSNNSDSTAAILAQLGIISSEAALAKFQSNSAVTLANQALTLSEESIIYNNLVFGGSDSSGTVTSVSANGTTDIGVTGSPITSSGTLNISLTNTAVTSGTYTNPTITVDNKGRITNAVSTTSIGGYTRYTANSVGNAIVAFSPIYISGIDVNRLTFTTFSVWDGAGTRPSNYQTWDMFWKPKSQSSAGGPTSTPQLDYFAGNPPTVGYTFQQLDVGTRTFNAQSVCITAQFVQISSTQVMVTFYAQAQPYDCVITSAIGPIYTQTANATASVTHYIDLQILGK